MTKSAARIEAEEAVRMAVHLETEHREAFWQVSDTDLAAGSRRKNGSIRPEASHDERLDRDQAAERASQAAQKARRLIEALPSDDGQQVMVLWDDLSDKAKAT